ncbi:hypothetical protein SQ11_05640 [Nitrosospira sp. NpAV]|nr:hypothetical protein SQ11_05640 [Nitrosospira sp. NpAV]
MLADEIANDPTAKGYAAYLADQPGQVVDLLNANTESMHKERWITTLTLMAELEIDMARSVLTKLEALSATDIVVKEFMAHLRSDKGADIGHPNTIAMIDLLMVVPAPAGFSAEEGAALKGLSLRPASRMEVLGLPYATEEILRTR